MYARRGYTKGNTMRSKLLLFVLIAVLAVSCKNKNNRYGSTPSITDTQRLQLEIEGGWALITGTGETENWFFSDARSGRYLRFKIEDEVISGTWSVRDRDIFLEDGSPRAVQIDGTILKIGNYRLQRDTLVHTKVQRLLRRELVGTWVSDDSIMVYEFMPNNYYQYRYTDEPDVPADGDWRIQGMRLIMDNNTQRADPITFNGNQMNWGMMTFYREGERPDISLSDAYVSNVGTKLTGNSFQADLGRFGIVDIVPYQKEQRQQFELVIQLEEKGRSVYTLPDFPGNVLGEFDGLRTIAARDVSGDDVNDILVMTDYLEDTGSRLKPITVNAVYTNLGRSFRLDSELTNLLSNNKEVRSIADMIDIAREQRPRARQVVNSNTKAKRINKSGSSRNYKKYVTDKSVCKIRVAAVKGQVDQTKVDKLSDLGILSFEAADNGYTYVYLGKYISKYTAYKVLDRVKARGYKSAFVVVEENFINKADTETPSYSTYQVASLKKLNLESLNALDDNFRSDIYVTYGDGYYRLSMGLYQKQLYPYIEEEFRNTAARLGYGSGYSRVIN